MGAKLVWRGLQHDPLGDVRLVLDPGGRVFIERLECDAMGGELWHPVYAGDAQPALDAFVDALTSPEALAVVERLK